MKAPAPFNLDQAIKTWRAELAQAPALRGENLDELEAHLRDSIAGLSGKGLSDEEMFIIARRRCGNRKQLQAEYSQPTRFETWFFRLVWMLLVGLAALNVAAAIFGSGEVRAAMAAEPFDLNVPIALFFFVAMAAGNTCVLRRAHPRLAHSGLRGVIFWLVAALFTASLTFASAASYQTFCEGWLSQFDVAPFGSEKSILAMDLGYGFGALQVLVALCLLANWSSGAVSRKRQRLVQA